MRKLQTIKSKIVHKNPWFKVREDKIRRTDGSAGTYFVVDKESFVAIIALTDKDEIYLVGQYRYPIQKYSWEIPQGGKEVNETILEAAKREFTEETQLKAKKWTKIGTFYLANGHCNQDGHVFLAEKISKAKDKLKPDEHQPLRLKKNPLKILQRQVAQNKPTDGPTLAALYQFEQFKLRQGEK